MSMTVSCNKECKKNVNNNVVQITKSDTVYTKCDSIIYELPLKATQVLVKMLSNKKVSFCIISRDIIDYGYTFSFSYDDKSLYNCGDSILLSKTNKFLKLGTLYYPVLTDIDYIFAQLPKDYAQGIINDFNYCFITVDTKGNIKEGFAY
jgi:hypothetical protein